MSTIETGDALSAMLGPLGPKLVFSVEETGKRDGVDALREAFDGAVTKAPLDERAPPPNGEDDYGGFDRAPREDDEPPPRIVCPTRFRGHTPPPRRWIARDWIPYGVVTGLYGDGGVGKSLLAQELQTATDLGAAWLGLPVGGLRKHERACGLVWSEQFRECVEEKMEKLANGNEDGPAVYMLTNVEGGPVAQPFPVLPAPKPMVTFADEPA